MKRQIRAVSTILTVILILIASIFGALVAYMWTMAPFYLEPENTVDLIITDANFPVENANYFNVTVMNPSHSVSAANITDIYITAPGFNKTSVTDSNPELGSFLLDRGTTKTINCSLLWGNIAGELVTVHVSTVNNTGAERSVQTQYVRLALNTFFNASQSINYFNISVASISSPINLSLSRVLVDFNLLNNTNLNATLPVIAQGQTIGLTCYFRWEGFVNPLIRVETTEGYAAEKQADARGTVSLQVTDVTFNDTNLNEVDVTLFNSPESAVGIDISNITLTHGNSTYTINGNLSNPALPMSISKNQTVVFACTWPWSDNANRDITITVNANTTQGFVSTKSVRTPPRVAANMTAVNIDLDNTGIFTINVTNLRYSLDTVNVTSIDLNGTSVGMSPMLLVPGQAATISCTFNWSTFVGQNARITFHVNSSSNAFPNFYDMPISYLKVTNADFSEFSENAPFTNVTVRNSEFSKVNATIIGVQVRTDNATFSVAGATGYEIEVGSEGAIVCPWNWKPYQTQNVTITVYTADGTQASATFEIP